MKAYIHSYICACVHRYMQGREGEAGLAPERESNRERERERERARQCSGCMGWRLIRDPPNEIHVQPEVHLLHEQGTLAAEIGTRTSLDQDLEPKTPRKPKLIQSQRQL